MRPFYTPHQLRHDQDDILFINEHWGEIKEAYFQVLEALKAPTIEAPETPAPEGTGCECTWVNKTLIPTYFYITLDDTAKDLTDTDVEEIIKNTEVTVMTYEGFDSETAGIPKQFPLMYLGKTDDGYKYAFPYSISDTVDSARYSTGHEKSILIQLHNRLSSYNTEGSSYVHGLTKTNGTLIYRDSYGVGGKWPATNKIILSLASEDLEIYPNLDWDYSSGYPSVQDTAKVYYYKHIDNGIEPTSMTFKFLDTVKVVETAEEDKPDNTPDTPPVEDVPEGVLTDYTVKLEFSPNYWYDGDPKFAVYDVETGLWKEAVKVVDNVVYFTFTEAEATSNTVWLFTRHDSTKEISWESKWNQTRDVGITFEDTIMDDVVTIDETNTTHITVGKAYV